MASTTETPEPTPLDRAINTASENTLRAVLRSICAKHEGSRKEAANQLLVKIVKNAEVKGDSETSDEEFVPRYAFCKACEKEFDITANTEKSCRYHPSPAEPTGEELWEDNYGEFEVDLPEYREEWPHCFTFDCCGENLETDPHGCVTDWHREKTTGNPLKRIREEVDSKVRCMRAKMSTA